MMTLLTDARNDFVESIGNGRPTSGEWTIDGIGIHPNNSVFVFFDRLVRPGTNDSDLLKSYIWKSVDGGETFRPLDAGDRAQVDREGLEVIFGRKFEGERNVLRIAPGALADDEGRRLERELLTPEFAAGPSLTLLSPMTRKAGPDYVRFRVDRPVAVYLVPIGVSGTSTEHDEAVASGSGKKLDVREGDVSKELSLSTDGLAPGIYFLRAWGGESAILELY